MIRKIIYLASALQAYSQKDDQKNVTDMKLVDHNLNQDQANSSKMNLTFVNKKELNPIQIEQNISKVLSQNTSFQSKVTVNATNIKKEVLNKTQEKSSNISKNITGSGDNWKVSKQGESKQEQGEEEWKREESFDGEFDTKHPSNFTRSKKLTNSTVKAVNNKSKIQNFKKNASNVSSFKGKKNDSKQTQKQQSVPKVLRVDLQREDIPLKTRDSKNKSNKQITLKTRSSKNQSKQPVVLKTKIAKNLSKLPIPLKAKVIKNLSGKAIKTREVKNHSNNFIPLQIIEPLNIRPKWQNQTETTQKKVNISKKSSKKSNIKKQKNASKQAKKKMSKNQTKQKKIINKRKQNKNKEIKVEKIVNEILNNEPYLPIKNLKNEKISQNKTIIAKQIRILPSQKKLDEQKQIQKKKQTGNLSKSNIVNEVKRAKDDSIPVKSFWDEEVKNQEQIKKNDKITQSKSEKKKANKNILKQKKLKKQKSLKKKSSQSKSLRNRNNSERVPVKNPFKRQNLKEKKRVVQPNPQQQNESKPAISKKQNLKKKSFKKSAIIAPVKGFPHTPIPVKSFWDEDVKNQKLIKKKDKIMKKKSEQKKANKNILKQKKFKKQKSLKKKSSQQKQLKNRNNSERVPIKNPLKRQIIKEKKRVVQPNPYKQNESKPAISMKQNLKKKSFKKNAIIVPVKGFPHTSIPIKDQKVKISKPAQQNFKIEVTNYVPSQDQQAEIIKITGTTYIPVVKSPGNTKQKIFLFKQKTYIPKKDQKIIIIGGRKYMAVTLLKSDKPQKATINKKQHQNPKQIKISSSSDKNQQYVPVKSNNAAVKVNTKISIKINDEYFVPIKNARVKTVVFEGARYVPVKQLDDSAQVHQPIKPNQKGLINVLRINEKVYIPMSAIPNKYRSIFKNKKANKTAKKHAKKPASSVAKKSEKSNFDVKKQSPKIKKLSKDIYKIEATNYIPLNDSNAEPIKIDGKTYIPVIKSPQNKLHKVLYFNGKKYIQMKNKDAIIIGGRKYLPVIAIKSDKSKKVLKNSNESTYNPKQIKTFKGISSSFKKTLIPVKNFNSPKELNSTKKIVNNTQSPAKQVSQPIKVNKMRAAPKSSKNKLQKKYKKLAKKGKSKRNDPVPIKNFKQSPIQIDGKTLITNSQPVRMGDHIYIPFNLKEKVQSAKQQKLKTLEIKKNKAIQINGVYYKTTKHTPVIIIGNTYYIPVKTLTTPLINIQGKRYIPQRNGKAKPITVQGKTYIPVQEANKEQIESSIPIVHKSQKKIATIRIGKITYIPVSVIPKEYRPVYKKKSEKIQKKWQNQPRLVIKINNKNYVPITNSSLKVIKLNNIKYIPVYQAPNKRNHQLKTVIPTKTGKIETIKIDGITYIPLHVIPQEHRRNFKPKKRIIPFSNPVIKINNRHFVPINHNKIKPVEIEGVVYIPVKQANATQIKKSKKINPRKGSHVETITIGGHTYIPINMIPKIYVPIFKKKIVSAQNNSIPTHVIRINNKDFIPHKQMKSIVFNGEKYFPVKLAPEDIVDELKPIKPNKKGKIATLKLQNVTYIPAGIIPKAFTKIFKPVNKNQKIVLLIKGNQYDPIHDKNVQPITIKGRLYFPVKLDTGKQTHNSKILASKQKHQIQKVKLGNQTYTYILIEFLPTKYRNILKKTSKIPNFPSHSIKINSIRFVPITNKTVKPIILNGKKYIPVYTAPKKNSEYLEHVEPAHNKKVDIIKIQNIHYIPEEVIPKEFIKVFKPVNKIITKPSPVIKIGKNSYVPSQNKKLKPIKVKGVVYIPVQRKNVSKDQSGREIFIKAIGKVKLIKIGNDYYLPVSAIPKVFRKTFKKNLNIKQSGIENFPTHVIKINGIHFVPITNEALKPVDFNGVKYIPVYQAPKHKIHLLQPVRPTKKGEIQTLNLKNITYIPVDVIPKAFRKVFKPSKINFKKLKHVIRIKNVNYVPVKNNKVKPIVVGGVTYIPVIKVKKTQIKKGALKITPRDNGNFNTIQIGEYTYIPQEAIPKVFHSVFIKNIDRKHKQIQNYPSVQIKINGVNYVPITNKIIKSLEIDGVKYLPVYQSQKKHIDYLESVSPVVKSKVEVLKIEGIHYIPVEVLPKEQVKSFEPVKEVLTQPHAVIKGEESNYVPIQGQKLAPVVIQGVTYIPVRQQHQAKNIHQRQTTIKTNGKLTVIKIGKTSYLPLKQIPKIYRALFKKNLIIKKRQIANIATHVIKINDISFVPITNKVVSPVVFNGVKYIPVYQAHSENIAHLTPVTPVKKGFIHTLNLKNITYIPIDVIPKQDRKEFRPVNKVVSSPYPVIEINKKYYSSEKSAEVIDINGITYIPIKIADDVEIRESKRITPKSKNSVQQIKLGKYTYIPIKQIPKAFRQILKKKVEIEDLIANKPYHSIKVNNIHYVPITNRYLKPIIYKGVQYIPVYQASSDIKHLKSVSSAKKGKIQTIKFGRIVYIPVEVIPKDFVKAFKPAKTKIVFNPVIKINNAYFIPSRSAQPIEIDGKTYISVQKASGRQIKSRKIILIKNGKQIQIIIIGKHSYIPLNSIPKIFRQLLKKSAMTGKKSYKVSPLEAAEFEKYYISKPQKSQKKAIKKNMSPLKIKKAIKKTKSQLKVKKAQSVPKVQKNQAKPKSKKKTKQPVKKTYNSSKKIINKPILKNKSIPTSTKPLKNHEKVNIAKEIKKLEELINRKVPNENYTIPIIRKEKLSIFNVTSNQVTSNKNNISIANDKAKIKSQFPIRLKQPSALKQINSSQVIQQNCECNLNKLNNSFQACVCEGQNAKVQISINSNASKAAFIPVSLIISNNHSQSLQNIQTKGKIIQSNNQKVQLIAPISQIIDTTTVKPILIKSQVISTLQNHII